MGVMLPTGTGLPGGRKSGQSIDPAILAAAVAALTDAAPDAQWLSGLVVDTKGKAGSAAYAYRNALGAKGVPVRGFSRSVKELRDFLQANGVEVPQYLADAKPTHHTWGLTRTKDLAAKFVAEEAPAPAPVAPDAG